MDKATESVSPDLLKKITEVVFEYHNTKAKKKSTIEVVDQTELSVAYCKVGKYCMVHVVSIPETPNRCFVLCHYGSDPTEAGKELAESLIGHFGYVPEMEKHVKGKAKNGDKVIPVIGFFVDKEQDAYSPEMQTLSN